MPGMMRLSLFSTVFALAAASPGLAQTSTISRPRPFKLRTVLELSTATTQRGKTFVDGPSFQPSLWIHAPYGFALGAWAAMPLTDRSGRDPVFYQQESGRPAKQDLYLYYKAPELAFLNIEAMLAQYQFPQRNRLPERVMNDIITKLSLPVPANPYLLASYGLSSVIKDDQYYEAGVQDTLLQSQLHSLQAAALTSYRKPAEPSPTKAEGFGHSQLTLAYGYGGTRLAANYLIEGEKAALNVNEDTAFNLTLSRTDVF